MFVIQLLSYNITVTQPNDNICMIIVAWSVLVLIIYLSATLFPWNLLWFLKSNFLYFSFESPQYVVCIPIVALYKVKFIYSKIYPFKCTVWFILTECIYSCNYYYSQDTEHFHPIPKVSSHPFIVSHLLLSQDLSN